MKKIIPLIFSVLYALNSNAQAVGGWGTCEFADVATMNTFDPSTNAYDCKKVFVQATNNHYYWNGLIWVLVQDTDDQNASEVPFTPVGTIVATDVQAAIAEIEPDIYGSVGVHSDVDVTTITPSGGDILAWDGANFVPSATNNGFTVFNIFAEESSGLETTGGTEWAFGNGDNTPSGHGIVIPVDCELFAMSLDHEGGANTTVRIIQNSNTSLTTYQIVNSSTEQSHITFGTPLAFTAGDVANFRTISSSLTGSSGRISAWFRIRATPASTSLVNDMLDVSAGSISNGDVLYFNGSSFVPLTLEATNIPITDAGGNFTATNVEDALSELANATNGNIYTTDGTLTGNREVTLGGNDLTMKGTSDVVFKSDGKIGLGISLPLSPLHISADGTGSNGIIRVEGTEPDMNFNDTDGGYTTLTFGNAGTDHIAFGRNSANDFYISRNASGWQDNSFVLQRSNGNVGIGTSSPAARLDVDGGNVRFSDYGVGTYEDTTAIYLLGVEADGDLVEMNTAKNSRIFYPPAMALIVDAVGTGFTLDLHQSYTLLFNGEGNSFIKSTTAPGAIPIYAKDELYYYILDYDDSIFDNVTIDDDGIMDYDVIAPAVDNCSFINIVFVVKEP